MADYPKEYRVSKSGQLILDKKYFNFITRQHIDYVSIARCQGYMGINNKLINIIKSKYQRSPYVVITPFYENKSKLNPEFWPYCLKEKTDKPELSIGEVFKITRFRGHIIYVDYVDRLLPKHFNSYIFAV